jgi:hypothetical protein
MKRITPLNILTAALLIWIGFGLLDNTLGLSQALWVLLLVVLVFIGDQVFRMLLGDLKRIWIVQMIFIASTVATAFAIWYIKS